MIPSKELLEYYSEGVDRAPFVGLIANGGNEIAGGWYARQRVAWRHEFDDRMVTSSVSNDVKFNRVTSDGGVVYALGLYTDQSGGKPFATLPLKRPMRIAIDVRPILEAGQISIAHGSA
jgi:hypothetical protein